MNWAQRHILNWRGLSLFLMALGFWYVMIPVIVPRVVPPSAYLDVRSVFVADSIGGEPPSVVVDRDINRAYVGGFVSTLRRIDEAEGLILDWCPVGGRTGIQYKAGSPYPGWDLNWWLGSPPADQCDIIPGQYQLRITWSIPTLFGFATLRRTVESLPFRVFSTINPPEAAK